MSQRKYIHTPKTDALITDAYRKLREYGNRRAVPALQLKLGWPKHAISQRAKAMGLARTKEKPWTDAEEQLLERWVGFSLGCIARKFRQRGYARSETAINLKVKRLHLRATADRWTQSAIAKALGVDPHVVTRWVKAGRMLAEAKGTSRTPQQGGDSLLIHRDEVRRFILNHPDDIDLAKVEKFWFLDVLSKGKLCEEFRREVAA